jgi:hypothetical protein
LWDKLVVTGGNYRRTLLRAVFPVEASNAAVKSGSLGKTLESMIARLKPESAYFSAHDGKRSATLVFDLKDPSDIPAIVEPLFLELNASVELQPVMNLDELRTGLEKASKNR